MRSTTKARIRRPCVPGCRRSCRVLHLLSKVEPRIRLFAAGETTHPTCPPDGGAGTRAALREVCGNGRGEGCANVNVRATRSGWLEDGCRGDLLCLASGLGW